MRVIVIGGTGHIGSYLVPRLVRTGHEVIVLARGEREPYHPDSAWQQVKRERVDRDAEDAAGTFGARIAALEPDAVVDLVCYTEDSARQLAEALAGKRTLLLHCGTIWVHGPLTEVPVAEDVPRKPFGDYGIAKAAIETYLLDQALDGGTPATVLHAGHIVGPGWEPCTPAGNFDLDVFGAIARGEEVALPNFGMETLHHVHADDVAAAFELAMSSANSRSAHIVGRFKRRVTEPLLGQTTSMARPCKQVSRSLGLPSSRWADWPVSGESFHVTSPKALTLRGYASAVAGWFGREPRLRFTPFDEWAKGVDPAHARTTWDHIAHSPSMSIEKARVTFGYAPRSSLEALRESLSWLVEQGRVDTGGRALV